MKSALVGSPIAANRNFFVIVAAAVWLLASATNATAAISQGPAPQSKFEEEQRRKMLFEQGEVSQEEKIRVGQQRNDRLQAERSAILKGMNAELEARRQTVQIQTAAANQATARVALDGWSKPLILISLLGVGALCFGFAIRRLKRPAEG